MNKELLKCRTVSLRLVDEKDAAFIYSLRINKNLNQHISNVTGGEEEQRVWLQKYKKREKNGDEFYFIIYRNDNGKSIGTVRIYGITKDRKFCWGSWILNEDKTVTAALESALLVYTFCFEFKNYHSAYFQVDKKNKNVIAFHKKIGAVFKYHDDVSENFEFSIDAYENLKKRYSKLIEG